MYDAGCVAGSGAGWCQLWVVGVAVCVACVGGGRERDRVKQRWNAKEREREIERESAKVRVRKSVREEIMPRYVYTQVFIHM